MRYILNRMGKDHETGFVENLRGIDKHTVHEEESD